MNKGRRTRTGCLCCRRRHKKCDEQKPSCKFCLSKGLECEWPMRGSVFVNYQQTDSSNQIADSVVLLQPPQQITFNFQPSVQRKEITSTIIPPSPKSTNLVTTPSSSISEDTLSIPSAPTSTTSDYQYYDTIKPNYTIQAYPTYIKEREFTRPKTQLPSLKNYHFLIPRETSPSHEKPAKRLSVDSLLN